MLMHVARATEAIHAKNYLMSSGPAINIFNLEETMRKLWPLAQSSL
jgi:hypothetical protein